MSNFLLLTIKGFFLGLAKIIPGVSGATLAITLGLYEKGIDAISNFKKNIKENTMFLLPLALGIGASVILASKLIKYALEYYYFPTMFLFIGLILGGVPSLRKNIGGSLLDKKKGFIFFFFFIIMLFVSILTSNVHDTSLTNNAVPSFLTLILLGIVEASTVVIPGISGTGVLMILGYYSFIISTLSDLTNLSNISKNIQIMLPFGLGILIGVILIAKLMNYLFKTKKESTYVAIFAFTIASIFLLFFQAFKVIPTLLEFIISTLFLILGFLSAYKLE